MKSSIVFSALTLAIPAVMATVPIYYQCGGAAYTGETECDAGLVCVVQNEFYSQCLPGTASTSKASSSTKSSSSTTKTSTSSTKTSSSSTKTSSSSTTTKSSPSLQLHPQVLPQHCPPPVAIVHLLPHLSLQAPSTVV
ncbi:hypothetical protein FRC02_006538 [Tulasnella sp. 418]|nr:hypothetical protein FRC02_006538 [Tulasnella sp. 418]